MRRSHSRLLAGGGGERPNRAVSKTAVSTGTVGSNPTSSATTRRVAAATRLVALGPALLARNYAERRRARYHKESAMVSSLESSVGTERKVVTELPGPKSRALHERRKAVVSAGLTVGSRCTSSGRRRDPRRRRRQPAARHGLGHRRHLHRPRGARGRRRGERPVAAFTHTCFMVAPYESYVEVCEELARLTPGDSPQDLRPVQLGRRSDRERREGRAPRHGTRRRSSSSTTPTTGAPT